MFSSSDEKLAVFNTAYLPSREYLLLIASSGKVMLDTSDYWQKQTLRNRTFILSANGVLNLIVPVMHTGGKKVMIKDIRISYDDPWIRLHKGAIIAAYNSSPFFEFFKEELWMIYDKKFEFLFDLNTFLLKWLLKKFKMDINIEIGQDMDSDQFTDFRKLSDSSTNSFIVFNDASLKPYSQTFNYKFPFVSNLSALDILCNSGTLF